MENKKYQIFISSTYTDLIEARQKVRDTILSLYHFPLGMEMFSADDDEQLEVIRDTIDCSDYYVLIIGGRYGSETSDGVSYTENEYDYAKSKGIPVLAFIRDRGIALRPEERESDSNKIEKLEKFINKAKASKMVTPWTTYDDLTTQVSIALHKIFHKKPRPGWVRADNIDFAQITQEITKLNQENRNLREENDRLLSQIVKRKPQIKLNIHDNNELVFNYSTKYNSYLEDVRTLSYDEVPEHLLKYITEEDIQNYNNLLPNEEELNKYKDDYKKYLRIKNTGQVFNIKVLNDGNAKANNIYMDIHFPKELLIMSDSDIKKYEEPLKIELPENIIKKANRENFNKHNTSMLAVTKLLNNSIYRFNNNGGDLQSSFLNTKFLIPNQNKSSWVENNILTIKIKTLLHTREIELDDDYRIIPLETGIFNITVSIICEEYEEKSRFTIPVVINKE
ncbi:DUF4062 domain-containing protein [Clostridium sp. FP2]|uniref:DUF4062 domain-containing protein n=1 Tax=Clostridium sp. FP2 TaxID=2724481 RepID=UPI0013E8FF0B|nr:DUF4062 domain-containing protein [Clostridium sp. FP2]MBZ9621399.1 DUF4062 domain-containing protein [Clostridium sp. FP2]